MNISKLKELRKQLNSNSNLTEIIEYVELIKLLTLEDYKKKYEENKKDDEAYLMLLMKTSITTTQSVLIQLLSDLKGFDLKD